MDDAYEENDVDSQAAPITLTGYADPGFFYKYAHADACHGAGDDDWYFIKTSEGLAENTLLRIRARIAPIGSCASNGGACDEYLLPPSPDNTVTIELYDATTHMAIGGATNDQGYAKAYGAGTAFANDVLVRVVGPANVSWQYTLDVLLRGGDYEDECEC
jgi:hypothetical protein